MSERVRLGVITAAHGIKGQVKIRSFTDDPEDLTAYGALTDRQGTKRFKISLHGSTPNGLIATIQGVADRNQAEALKGQELYAERELLPSAEEEEFYPDMLIGLEVRGADGAVLGKIMNLYNFGAGDIVEITLTGTRKKEMYPFTKAIFTEIMLAEGYCVAELPEEI